MTWFCLLLLLQLWGSRYAVVTILLYNWGLKFNPSKTQLIRSPSSTALLTFIFVSSYFPFSTPSCTSATFFTIISVTLIEDVNSKLHDMVRKANCLLATFPRVGPSILTHLFQSYCLSLYNSGLSYALLFRTLNLLSVRFSVESGVFQPVVTPTLFTTLPSLFNVIYRHSNFHTKCVPRNGACTKFTACLCLCHFLWLSDAAWSPLVVQPPCQENRIANAKASLHVKSFQEVLFHM